MKLFGDEIVNVFFVMKSALTLNCQGNFYTKKNLNYSYM